MCPLALCVTRQNVHLTTINVSYIHLMREDTGDYPLLVLSIQITSQLHRVFAAERNSHPDSHFASWVSAVADMIVKEFRIILPMTVEEYNVAQLWSVAEVSKNETGGGEGIEVLVNEPFNDENYKPSPPLYIGGKLYDQGHSKGLLEVDERAWNAYPYCRTIIENPKYMNDKFFLKIESIYMQDNVSEENVSLTKVFPYFFIELTLVYYAYPIAA
ncbi:hypothetical protein AHF37_01248 [Paragonimus kellicotti]|nr:hypothetical protein AHF37_01248 [Paragonimus kellicotti]